MAKHRSPMARVNGLRAQSPSTHLQALEQASIYDDTLVSDPTHHARLEEIFVPSQRYTRDALFNAMLTGEPCVLRGFPRPTCGPLADVPLNEVANGVFDWMKRRRSNEKHRVFAGKTGVRRDLTMKDVAAKWNADRSPFGVTDLHIRDTASERIISPDTISGFNLLPVGTSAARTQEMFSYVISSSGYVTDSHSDAPDSTNYCFAGQKLWIAWDTYEGLHNGLQDIERVIAHDKAVFDLDRWLELPSARWCLVTPGDTLFMPAHLTHKVVTLERYIGVGGFYIALPNCMRLLQHWIVRGPLWSKRDRTGECDSIIDEIVETLVLKLDQLKNAPKKEQTRWAYDYFNKSVDHFFATCPEEHCRTLLADRRFQPMIKYLEREGFSNAYINDLAA